MNTINIWFHMIYYTTLCILASERFSQIFSEGTMSSSSSVSVSDEFTGFSSTSNGSTGRVIETNKDIDSAASFATTSCMKD